MYKFVKNNWKSFKADKRGNFAILTALTAPLMVFTIGSAVDFANFRQASSAAQAAIDSASIAASRAITVNDATLAEATDIARQQLSLTIRNISFIDAQAAQNSLRIEQDTSTGTLVASADIQTPTFFADIFGFENLSGTVSATNQVDRLEIAFVLDNTGSMSFGINGVVNQSNERLVALRNAMTVAVDQLLPGGNDDRVKISIVPYSHSVNLGASYDDAVQTGIPDRADITCVTEREGSIGLDDVAPEFGDNETFYESDIALTANRFEGFRDFTDSVWAPCPAVALRPLTNDRKALMDDIENFVPAGFTGGQLGITWGLNTLSGNWSEFWPEGSQPEAYGTPGVRKILVVMTDGAFNTSFLDSKLTENASIEQSDDGDAQGLMNDCAGVDERAFIALNAGELEAAFEQIVIEARTAVVTN